MIVKALSLLGLLTLAAGASPGGDPCLPQNHKLLDQPDRSTAVTIRPTDAGRTDENLQRGWYAFVSAAGGEIPTSAPNPGECSSKKPIWLNGTQPILDGQIHTLNLCYSLGAFSPCGIKLQIRAKRCVSNIVYELVPTSSANTNSSVRITDATYCAGKEKLCPPGQSSMTGFTPNCYVAPTVGSKPIIDVVEFPDTFEFHCVLTNPRPQAAYRVTWKLGYSKLYEEELQVGQSVAKLPESKLVVSPGQTVLGKNLTCSVQGRYLNEPPGRWGGPKSSEPYFLGIEVSDASGMPLQLQSFTLTLPEHHSDQTINIRSTIPVRCGGLLTRLLSADCKIEIAIRHDNSMDRKPLRCKNGIVEQLKLAKCSVTITPDNWSVSQPISIRATKDFKYDGARPRVIEFTMTDGPGRSIWDGYVPHSIQVVTEDFIDKRAQCSSLNDPHMTTFDGHKWHNYFEGEFVLYRHTQLPFEVRAFYKRCSARSSASCNCAVAARAGDDVIVVDRCNSMGDVKIWGSGDKKVEYNLLRTRTISTDDIISPNFKIYSINGGREYSIYFPHGMMVRAQLTGGGYAQFMNLWVNPSPADYNMSEGMCGNFNGDKTDDLRWRNGSIYTGPGAGNNQHPKIFSKHWRVLEDESIYNGRVPLSATTYRQQYCSCVKGQGPSAQAFLDCNDNSDAQRCDQRGEDITGANFEYSSGTTKTAKPFVFDPDWNPPEPTWPTPSGWTKANATKFCKDFIMKSKAFQHCNITIGDDVDMCVEDIRLSDGVQFAMTALESYKDKCLMEMSKEVDANIPSDAFCLNECNGNGYCHNQECVCDPGYYAEDCSLSASSIPNVYFTPFCDISKETCDTADVYGDGFIKSSDLTCTFQPAEISDGKLNLHGSKEQVEGAYQNFAEVKCLIAKGRSKRSVASSNVAGQLAVSVANKPGSQASNVIIYTKYDSRCQTCNFSSGECSIKDGMCLIEGNCYKDGDGNPAVPVKSNRPVCRPEHSQSTWYSVQGPTLPTWAIAVIAVSATLAAVAFAVVIYKKVIQPRAKVYDN